VKKSLGDATTIIVMEELALIAGARSLYEKLGEALARKRPVVLDGSLVERSDAAVLQVLASFVAETRVSEMDIEWKEPSEALRRDARSLGLSEHLALPLPSTDSKTAIQL